MGLNELRDEASAFLKRIGKENEPIKLKVNMLQTELDALKFSLDDRTPMRHKVYDMLFLLFEIAAQAEMDLDDEWSAGKERKERKYFGYC